MEKQRDSNGSYALAHFAKKLMSLFVAEYVVRFADGGGMELVKQRVHMVRGD